MNIASIPRKTDGRKGFIQIYQDIRMPTEAKLVCPDRHVRALDAAILGSVGRAISLIENEIVEDHGLNIYVIHHPNFPGIVEISWGDPAIGLVQFHAEELLLQIDPWLINSYLAKKKLLFG